MKNIWTEDIPLAGHTLIDAESFNAWSLGFCREAGLPETVLHHTESSKALKVGTGKFYVRPFPKKAMQSRWRFMPPEMLPTSLTVNRRNREVGSVSFTDTAFIPILFDAHNDVWMSLTPSEVYSQRTAYRHARGKVLMGGLGMGWLARRVAALNKVKSVTVIEKDAAIIEAFSKKMPKNVRIIQSDAYLYGEEKLQDFDSVLFDIWKGYGQARDDRRWLAIEDNCRKRGIGHWAWD